MHLKTALRSCMAGMLGLGMTTVHAARVSAWTLTDFNADGLKSDFGFHTTIPSGNSVNAFGAGNEVCGGAACRDIAFDSGPVGANEFTTGFDFNGIGNVFQPIIISNIAADIDTALAAAGDGQALQFSSLGWGFVQDLTNTTYDQTVNVLQNCTGAPDGLLGTSCGSDDLVSDPSLSNPKGYHVEITDLTGGDYGVVVRFKSMPIPGGMTFGGQETHWRLEGVMHTVVPVPAALWLFGSGLLGLVGVLRSRQYAGSGTLRN